MEEVRIRNLAELRGVLAAAPVFSHMSRGERFFIFPIETRRLSGAVDRINVVARQSLLDAVPIGETGCLHITGELRSFNNKRGEGAKLVITVFARSIAFDEGEAGIGALGAVEFEIPAEVTDPIRAQNSPLAEA